MKLKKIASLMLAGIMAVSMLAGCKSGTEPTEPENPVAPAATNLAGYVNGLLSEDVAKNIKFTDDTELRAALNTVAGKSSNVTSADIKTKNTAVDVANGGNANLGRKVKAEFDSGVIQVQDLKNWIVDDAASNDGVASYLEVYVLDGDMTEMNVANAMVDAWNVFLAQMNSTSVSGKKCDWAGNVSAVKVYDNTDPDTSAWVLGVMITKTVSDIENTVE